MAACKDLKAGCELTAKLICALAADVAELKMRERTGKSSDRNSARSRHLPDVTMPRTPFFCKAVARRPPSEALLASAVRESASAKT